MKIYDFVKLSTLIGFFLNAVSAYENPELETQQLRALKSSSLLNMTQNFREPKKILFSCTVGGSSHAHWLLSILNELDHRGHKTSYMSRGKHATFSVIYPNINTIILGPDYAVNASEEKAYSKSSQLDSMVLIYKLIFQSFAIDYSNMLEVMKDGDYDVVICDSVNVPCIAAASKLKVPTIVTSSMPLSKDAAAPYINNDFVNYNIPTTEFMSFWERLYTRLIQPVEFMWKSRHFLIEQRKIAKSHGIDLPLQLHKMWDHHMKMHNTAFGFQYARPLGPLVEFIGPIIRKNIPSLDSELATYLDQHHRVVYLGFGQLAFLRQNDISLILTGLLEAYERGEIDGFIWAKRDMGDQFPSQLTTESGTVYTHFNQSSSDFMFPVWAPQMAILNHPSVMMFVTHGGSSSIAESLYAGVRMVVYPLYSDQPAAAVTGERNGYALKLNSKVTQKEANSIISRVARDDNQEFQRNTDRFKALVQIRSKNGIEKGADIVEEVAFLSEDGIVPHRRDIKHNMSFMKATNLDIYMFAAVVTCGVIYSVIHLCISIGRYVMPVRHTAQKIKEM